MIEAVLIALAIVLWSVFIGMFVGEAVAQTPLGQRFTGAFIWLSTLLDRAWTSLVGGRRG